MNITPSIQAFGCMLSALATRCKAAPAGRARLADLASFRNNNSGNVTMIFALSAIPALALIGAAVDYGQGNDDKARLQNSLDAAVLAALEAPSANQIAVANAVFKANLASSKDFVLSASSSTAGTQTTGTSTNSAQTTGSAQSNTTVTFTANADGSFSGAAMANIVTGVMGTTVSMSVSSKANPGSAQTASNVIFTLTGGYGWYWKEVDLYTHQPGASSDTLLASYIYQPVDLSYQGGRGDGTVTAQFLSNGAMVSGFVNTAVSLGTTYDNAYMTMTVYSDGCGPGMAPETAQSTSTTNVVCVASGTKVQTGTREGQARYTTYTKTATPVVYSTNDATTANHLFIQANGVNTDMPLGQVVSVFTLLPCGQTVQHSWEDTPWNASQGMTGSWQYQDIFFNVQTTACAANANYTGGQPYLAN